MVLSSPLIIPCVTVLCNSNPSGLPIAIDMSPIETLSLSPSSAGVRPVLFTFTTAKSNCESYQTTLPSILEPSLNSTFTFFASPSEIHLSLLLYLFPHLLIQLE